MQQQARHAPTLKQIRSAKKALAPYIIRSPLLPFAGDSVASKIFLKLENLQPIGAFKIRCMGNAVLSAEATNSGVYTASSGNAGIGLAAIADALGIPARVYAPEFAPPDKLQAMRDLAAEVLIISDDDWWQIILHGGHAGDSGRYVDAVRDPAAMAGNGTIGLEILEQLPDAATIVVPFGGGGLTCGIASAVKALRPGVRIIVAECDTAAPVNAAFAAGKAVSVSMQPSFISGAGAPTVLSEMWPLVSELVDDTIVVPEADVAEAVRLLFAHNKVIAEGAGAISLAASLSAQGLSGPVVSVVSGGNIDPAVMAKILRRQSLR